MSPGTPPEILRDAAALIPHLRPGLAGDDPVLSVLRDQLQVSHVRERTMTGVGFFLDFDLDSAAPILDGEPQSLPVW